MVPTMPNLAEIASATAKTVDQNLERISLIHVSWKQKGSLLHSFSPHQTLRFDLFPGVQQRRNNMFGSQHHYPVFMNCNCSMFVPPRCLFLDCLPPNPHLPLCFLESALALSTSQDLLDSWQFVVNQISLTASHLDAETSPQLKFCVCLSFSHCTLFLWCVMLYSAEITELFHSLNCRCQR